MMNMILWTLDNEVDGDRFERLCVDLLYRTGFEDINPVGRRKDRGRDAEVDRRPGSPLISPVGEKVFCGFSLQDRWESKLRDDLEKVRTNQHDIDAFLFVTTASVSGSKRDTLTASVKKSYGWRLEIRDREWLRLQLEEASPDLAQRYLGIPAQDGATLTGELPKLTSRTSAAKLFNAGRYGLAAVALAERLAKTPDDHAGWRALAWCHYAERHYVDALGAIREAARLKPRDLHTRRVHACILIEHGIMTRQRAGVLRGRDLLLDVSRTSRSRFDAFNLGNALSALGDTQGAIDAYREALLVDPQWPAALKNLGSEYERLGDAGEALRCYEAALGLDPNLPEALFAKATILIKQQDLAGGIALLRQVLDSNAHVRTQWAAAWWWLADAYRRIEDVAAALRVASDALGQFPSNAALQDLKAVLLAENWNKSRAFRKEAEEFFRFKIELDPTDFRPVQSLSQILLETGREGAVWPLLDGYLGDAAASEALRNLGHPSRDLLLALRHLRTYERYRQARPVSDYAEALRAAGFPLSKMAENSLAWVFLEPFATAWRDARATGERDEPAFTRLMEQQTTRVREAIVRWVDRSLSDLPMLTNDVKIDIMAALACACPTTALVECSREIGFIGGILSFEIDPERVVMPPALLEIEKLTLVEVLTAANRHLNLLRDDTPTD